MASTAPPSRQSFRATVARGVGSTILGFGAAGAAQLAMAILLSRKTAPDQAGWFFSSYAACRILAVLGTAGMDYTVIRFAARQLAGGRVHAARFVVRRCALVAAALTSACVPVAALASFLLVGSPRHAEEQVCLLLIVAAPFLSLETVLIAATRATGRMSATVLVDQGFDGVVKLALLFVGLEWDGIVGASLGFVLGGMLTTIAATVAARSLLIGREDASQASFAEILRYGRFQWGASGADVAILWIDTLLIALLRGPGAAAVYSLATRVVQFGMIFAAPLGLTFQPHIGHLIERREYGALRDAYRDATLAGTLIAGPPLVALAAASSPLLSGLYGDHYALGATALAALALGQVAAVATGPGGHIVGMWGHGGWTFRASLIALTTNLFLNLLLIPPYGYTGAGIAWAAALVVWNVVRLRQAERLVHTLPFSRGTIVAVGLLAGFGLAIYELTHPVSTSVWSVLGAGGLVGLYLALVLVALRAWVRARPTNGSRLLDVPEGA